MDNKFEPLPTRADVNGDNLLHIPIDKADIPMLIRAISVGAISVMMGGRGDARRRMYHYKKLLKDLVPPGWQHFRFAEDVSNIVLAINENSKCVFDFKKVRWHNKGVVTVTVGNQVWDTYRTTTPQCLEMIEFMKAILPLSCEFEITGDIPKEEV